MTQRAALAELLRARSVTHGDFLLSSGQRSSFYIDARKTTMSAEGQQLIGTLGVQAIRKAGWKPSAVGGLTMGADPVAYAIARASLDDPPAFDAFSVRKASKQHGTGRRIEGNFEPGAAVVVIEDVITTGGSALEAIAAIRETQGTILGLLTVVDREQGGRAALEAEGIQVVALATMAELDLK